MRKDWLGTTSAINYFVRMDPIGKLTDIANFGNGLGYVGNDPVNASDPSGLCEIDDEGNFIGCVTEYCPKECPPTKDEIENSYVPSCFCRDWGLGNPLFSGMKCYRSLKDNRHCCYDSDTGTLPDHPWAEHDDTIRPLEGARPNGDCNYHVGLVTPHIIVDTIPDLAVEGFGKVVQGGRLVIRGGAAALRGGAAAAEAAAHGVAAAADFLWPFN